jgi:hypothetical protein
MQFAIAFPTDADSWRVVPGQEHAIEDWGRIRRAFA